MFFEGQGKLDSGLGADFDQSDWGGGAVAVNALSGNKAVRIVGIVVINDVDSGDIFLEEGLKQKGLQVIVRRVVIFFLEMGQKSFVVVRHFLYICEYINEDTFFARKSYRRG